MPEVSKKAYRFRNSSLPAVILSKHQVVFRENNNEKARVPVQACLGLRLVLREKIKGIKKNICFLSYNEELA